MLTALTRPPAGHLRVEWERTGPPALRVRVDFPRRRSTAGVRAALASLVAARLAKAGEWDRREALDQLNRDLDRAARSGWI